MKTKINKLILVFLLSFEILKANFFNHSPIQYFIPKYRILIESYIFENVSFLTSRVYFKSDKMTNFSFVPMKCKKGVCRGTIPALDSNSKKLSYFMFFLTSDNQQVVTKVFEVPQHFLPDWEALKNEKEILISYENNTYSLKNRFNYILSDFDDKVAINPSSGFLFKNSLENRKQNNYYEDYNYDYMMQFTP